MEPLAEDVAFLEHFGVKGMRWGVINERRREKREAKADKKWVKGIESTSMIKLHNAVAEKLNGGRLKEFNSRPENKGPKNWDNPDKHTKDYIRRYNKLCSEATKDAVEEMFGESPSGQFKATYVRTGGNKFRVQVVKQEVRHADEDELVFIYEGELTPTGFGPIELIDHNFEHGDLLHYGVKGMRWGVINKRRSTTRLSAEAKKAREHKKRPAASLTNKQLRALNERVQLESQHKKLNPSRKQRGEDAVKGLLATAGIGVAAYNLVKSPAGRAAVESGKRFMRRPAPSRAFQLSDLVSR